MQTELLNHVRNFLKQHRLQQVSIVVGVSGGLDSVCLLRGLLAVRDECELTLAVCHFDHALRAESSEDAIWVEELCERFKIPCFTSRREDSGSLSEESARKSRYEFFESALVKFDAQYLAVAHHQDDTVETVLHHFIRGTGLRGLAGIPSQRKLSHGYLIRPLLGLRRECLERSMNEWSQPFRDDSTNLESLYTRNRIRNELIPLIKDQFNPQFADAVQRLAVQASEMQTVLDSIIEPVVKECAIETHPERIVLDLVRLQSLPAPMIRYCLQEVWKRNGWRRQDLSSQHLHRLSDMIESGTPRRLSLPHRKEAVRVKKTLVLRNLPRVNPESNTELNPDDFSPEDAF